MIPRDFMPPFSFMEWQWFEPDLENQYKQPMYWKQVCKACGCVIVENWKQGHAKWHWQRKEVPHGMNNPFL